MSGGFEGKVAIVTGGTQGLGEATARLFVERGARGVVICGRNAEKGERVRADLAAAGAEALFVAADLGELDHVRKVAKAADDAFGRVDCLVNVAAITDRGTILDTSPELYERMFAINVRAPFFLMQDTATIMRREKIAGTMVNILSMSSHGGQPFTCAYSASKAALAGLTKNVAYSLMRDRIRVNGLNIGWMNTPGEHAIQKRAHNAPDGWLDAASERLPFGRLLETSEVARAIAFLASDESGMMTGSLVDMDQSVLGCYDAAPQPVAPL
ncbi:MAG: SDR family oxidoreductase [Geminicoccaceae bacterium]|jgi:NAD(P)-dependent dehydrogenase (short-subunit alcohol dehydrogenase family)|nr:SDR family oxidoreductase [Geminicoccaceae bacterium]